MAKGTVKVTRLTAETGARDKEHNRKQKKKMYILP